MEYSGMHFPGGPIRTVGDGRENPDGAEDPLILASKLGALCVGMKQLQAPPEDLSKLSFSPVRPVGEVVWLTPHLAPRSAPKGLTSGANKEPKFVPYEPYKGAVQPIMTCKKKLKRTASTDVEMCRESTKELLTPPPHTKVQGVAEATLIAKVQSLETELRFQEQVNSELKRMLVAAVGEDVEVKVHHLTEDKLHLARALVNNSESITSHQEKLETVSGQCEVWRSKFLASSLMVDELSRCKNELVLISKQLQESLKEILAENCSAKESMKKTLRNLQVLRENFDPASGLNMGSPQRKNSNFNSPMSCNLVEMAGANLKLSDSLGHRLLGYIPPPGRENLLDALPTHSPAELRALSLLQSSVSGTMGVSPDEACSAVVGAAAAAGCQLFPHVSCTPTACCGQCQGEIHQL